MQVMGAVLAVVRDNLEVVRAAPWAFAVLFVAAVLVAYQLVSWYHGGRLKHLEQELARAKGAQPAVSRQPKVFLRRDVRWIPCEEVTEQFWVAGTSLISVAERRLLQDLSQRCSDIRIILPSADARHLSWHQLDLFDRMPNVRHVHDQVEVARRSFRHLEEQLTHLGLDIDAHLRCYDGVMYANVTLYRDKAYYSPYDSTGIGESNITIEIDAALHPALYRAVRDEFLRMWNAPPGLGEIVSPKRKRA